MPHATLGEELVLTLRVRPDSALDAAAVKAHFGAHLAAFKVPAHVALQTEELPKNASGSALVYGELKAAELSSEQAQHYVDDGSGASKPGREWQILATSIVIEP